MNYEPCWSDWSLEWTRKLTTGEGEHAEFQRLIHAPFMGIARPAQKPPPGDWRTWLFMGGRGAGKTRAGAEWTRFSALYGGCRRIALVGPTLSDVREVMIEGPSGLRNLEVEGEICNPPRYESSRHRLVWDNGAEAYAFSSEDPDSLRGPQFDAAWCDELAAWANGEAVWDMLQMALRTGKNPRCVATTTPRPVPLIKRLVALKSVALTRGTTYDNAANLAPAFIDNVELEYAGTLLGRQELDGELIEDPSGALWTRGMIETSRIAHAPELDEIIVAVDPPVTSGPHADACGIVAAGMVRAEGFGRRCFILADASAQGLRPLDWAGRAVALAHRTGASRIVVEANQGGEMTAMALETAGCDVAIEMVRASVSKTARATPVVALYQKGMVAHVGVLRALEDEMCAFGAAGYTRSPDRVDALVWAVWTLMISRRADPRIRSF